MNPKTSTAPVITHTCQCNNGMTVWWRNNPGLAKASIGIFQTLDKSLERVILVNNVNRAEAIARILIEDFNEVDA